MNGKKSKAIRKKLNKALKDAGQSDTLSTGKEVKFPWGQRMNTVKAVYRKMKGGDLV